MRIKEIKLFARVEHYTEIEQAITKGVELIKSHKLAKATLEVEIGSESIEIAIWVGMSLNSISEQLETVLNWYYKK
jgi:hypothetical protein|tara:strand:+ start:16410 stop:16637 length:228 start_codon:yes stop_codon:yes gene_type:complete